MISLARPRSAVPTGRRRRRGSADWLRLARLARVLSWLTLAWLGVEGGVAIGAAVAAGSVALLGFGLDSGIESLASIIVIWRFTGTRLASATAERRAQQLVAVSFFLLGPYIAVEAVWALAAGDRAETSIAGLVLTAGTAIFEPAPRGGQAADRRPARIGRHRRGGHAEPAVRVPGHRGVRRAGRQHRARRLVARRRGRAGHRGMGSHRGTAGLGRKNMRVRMPSPEHAADGRQQRSLSVQSCSDPVRALGHHHGRHHRQRQREYLGRRCLVARRNPVLLRRLLRRRRRDLVPRLAGHPGQRSTMRSRPKSAAMSSRPPSAST